MTLHGGHCAILRSACHIDHTISVPIHSITLMWLIVIFMIMFYCWPLLLALGLWLAWNMTKKRIFRLLAGLCIVLNVVWILGVYLFR